MARGGQKRGWDQLSPRYRERLEKRGVTETQYESPFFSLQRARGHRPLIREGRRVGGEKVALEQRRREKGALSDSERKFFKRQTGKVSRYESHAEQTRKIDAARAAFEKMSPSQRSQVMGAQANLARGLRQRRSRARRGSRSRQPGGVAVGSGGGPIGSDYGGGGSYSFGGAASFDEWYEDEFPDFDDGAELLLYYH